MRVRWLGTVTYQEALVLQHALVRGTDDWLLLLEHPHIYTIGRGGDPANILLPDTRLGADVVRTDRGGDVTYHGPGQLVGYPILSLPGARGGGLTDTTAYVRSIEQLLIDALRDVGLGEVGRLRGYPGVWVDPGSDRPQKLASIGVRIARGRSMHGFALNVDPDLSWFGRIVPCGIRGKGVTSLRALGITTSLQSIVDLVVERAVSGWATPPRRWERQDVVWPSEVGDLRPLGEQGAAEQVAAGGEVPVRLQRRLAQAQVGDVIDRGAPKPAWLRRTVGATDGYERLRDALATLELTTVCEEAACPNLFECWNEGTATFMINGDRCTRACGFCLVDTRRPEPLDATEPARVAEAVLRMGLQYAVITAVARDDLPDGGASGFAATVQAIRAATPEVSIELLIPDCKGDAQALQTLFGLCPEVLNHNIETVPRLHRAVRPSAGYARSLALLARAKEEGLTTKSGLILGMGESRNEVEATLADLAGVGIDIVTIGQYLRPSASHLPVARWWPPEELLALKESGEAMGIPHVEATPLTRSSHHAHQAARSVSVSLART